MSDKPYNEPAFPVAGAVAEHQFCGMSLRDFFIAHAPTEPQPWFEPTMPTERPTEPRVPEVPSVSQNHRDYVREYRDVMKPEEGHHPILCEHIKDFQSNRKAVRAWNAERSKQRYVQWPAAWADEMLKARQS